MPLITSTPFNVSYVNYAKSLNPTAYWRLGESSGTTAFDETGNHNGTYVNTPDLGQPSLLTTDSDTSVGFTAGNSEYMNVPDAVALRPGTGDYSVSLWVNAPDVAVVAPLFEKRKNSAPTIQFSVYIIEETSGTVPTKKIGVTVLQGDFQRRIKRTVNDIIDGNTHHIVATWDVSTNDVKLWADGVDQTLTNLSVVGTVTNVTNTDPIRLGTSQSGKALTGTVDEVSVYNTVLSAAHVQTLYNLGTA